MYKYDPAVTVVTKGGNTYEFGAEYGISAKRSIDQKTAVDTIDDDEGKRTFIPYEAVDHVVIDGMSQQVSAPVDANCVVKRGVGTPETLNITNSSDVIEHIRVFLKTNSPVTYGDYAFTTDASENYGQGWYTTEGTISINGKSTVTISGIPDGTQYHVVGNAKNYQGVIPADVEFSGGIK